MSSGYFFRVRVRVRVPGSGPKKKFYVLGLFFPGSGPGSGTGFGFWKKFLCPRVIFSGFRGIVPDPTRPGTRYTLCFSFQLVESPSYNFFLAKESFTILQSINLTKYWKTKYFQYHRFLPHVISTWRLKFVSLLLCVWGGRGFRNIVLSLGHI